MSIHSVKSRERKLGCCEPTHSWTHAASTLPPPHPPKKNLNLQLTAGILTNNSPITLALLCFSRSLTSALTSATKTPLWFLFSLRNVLLLAAVAVARRGAHIVLKTLELMRRPKKTCRPSPKTLH